MTPSHTSIDENTVFFGEAANDRMGPLAPAEVTRAIAVPYDPARTRENLRGLIALILIGLLTAIIVATFALF